MKNYNIILVALLLSLMGVSSGCSKENGMNVVNTPKHIGTDYNVSFSLSVGVETYSIPAQDYEKSISSLQVLLFDKRDNFVALPDLITIDPLTNLYGFSFDREGLYQMLVVTNHLFKASELYGKTITQVGEMLIDRAEPGTAHKFVMVSQKKDFNIQPHQITTIGQINLTRLAARIDIQTDLEGLVLNKVTVTNRKIQSALLAQSNTDSYTNESKEYTTFTDFGIASSNASIGQIYTFENGKTGIDAEGIYLIIETTYNGAKIKPITIPLPAVKRNYIYSVQLTMSNKDEFPDKTSLSFVLTVMDWQNGTIINIPAAELLKIVD